MTKYFNCKYRTFLHTSARKFNLFKKAWVLFEIVSHFFPFFCLMFCEVFSFNGMVFLRNLTCGTHLDFVYSYSLRCKKSLIEARFKNLYSGSGWYLVKEVLGTCLFRETIHCVVIHCIKIF